MPQFGLGIVISAWAWSIRPGHGQFGLGLVTLAWAWSIWPGHGRIFESHATTLRASPAGAFFFDSLDFVLWASVFFAIFDRFRPPRCETRSPGVKIYAANRKDINFGFELSKLGFLKVRPVYY